MATRKKSKKSAPEVNPIQELCAVAKEIARTENLDEDAVLDAIERAIVTSLKQKYRIGKKVDVASVLTCKIDKETERMDVILHKKVVDEFFDHKLHILTSRAQFYAPGCVAGDKVFVPLEPENYVDNTPGDMDNPDDPAFLYAYEPLDPEDAFFEYAEKTVVDEMNTPELTILVDEAREIRPGVNVGDVIEIRLHPDDYGFYQIAHKCKNIMVQNIKELRNDAKQKKFDSQAGEIKTGIVKFINESNNAVTITIDGTDAYLTKEGQIIPGDKYKVGEHVKVYLGTPSRNSDGDLKLDITRSHREFIRALFKNEVPEIADGTVEIRSITREAGSRTKMAVWSDSIDPVGACIGDHSIRVNAVTEELGGTEKIDIIKYSDNKIEFVAAALAPATVRKVIIDSEDENKCIAVVDHEKVSLAIGKSGQNARLAAQLTGMKIEVWDASEHPTALEEKTEAPAEAQAEVTEE